MLRFPRPHKGLRNVRERYELLTQHHLVANCEEGTLRRAGVGQSAHFKSPHGRGALGFIHDKMATTTGCNLDFMVPCVCLSLPTCNFRFRTWQDVQRASPHSPQSRLPPPLPQEMVRRRPQHSAVPGRHVSLVLITLSSCTLDMGVCVCFTRSSRCHHAALPRGGILPILQNLGRVCEAIDATCERGIVDSSSHN